ncbi:MAG: hypothetical protein WAV27_12150 [Xanthobacteraceae bacterium]|jgi:hypothetical protein
MKISARRLVFGAPLLVGLVLMSSALAQSAATSLKQQLVGHWQLVSVALGDGTPYGAAPQGSMFLDTEGHLSVIVISDGGARNISYFGTYTVDDAAKSMTIHVDGSSGGSGNTSGRSFKRLLQLQGNELVMTNEAPANGPGVIKQTWKQAN